MREINLSNLSRSKTQINWCKSVGCKIDFVYDEIKGVFEIVSYDSKTRKLLIRYQDQLIMTSRSKIFNCNLDKILGKIVVEYRYRVGDILASENRKIKITEQIPYKDRKGYKYVCLYCEHSGITTENVLVNSIPCPVCSNKKVKIGFNDMWTTNPELALLLANPNDGYKYTQNSRFTVDWRCPDCGEIAYNKNIDKVNRGGLSCKKCSDGISYPNKIMYNLLTQLSIKFKVEKTFKWCKYKLNEKTHIGRFDFYFKTNGKEYIVEMDGFFHQNDNLMNNISALDSKFVDWQKDGLAKLHNIEVIRIDCVESDINYIKNNVLKSKLSSILNLKAIDWNECDKYARKSKIHDACELWNSGIKNTGKIAKMLQIKQGTAIKYLKQGAVLDICDYRNLRATKVKCITTGEVFGTMTSASKKYGISISGICYCCKNIYSYSGKLNDGTKLKWCYV